MEDFYETSYVKPGRDGRRPRLCVTYRDADGERHERTRASDTKRMSALRREAEEWRAELNDEWRAQRADEEERRRREEAESKIPKLADHIWGFIDDRVGDGIERSTVRGYRQRARLILDPDGGLADLRLDQITTDGCRAWMRHLRTDRGLAPATIASTLNLLRSALNVAVDDEVIPSNPARQVKAPRRRKQTPNALDRRSVAALESWIAGRGGDWFTTFVAIGLYTGMREGEISALRWRDVDMGYAVIHLRHAIGRAVDGDYLKGPKNGNPRDIAIPNELMRALERRRAQVMEELAILYNEEEAPLLIRDLYVCGHSDGTWQSPQVISNRWRRLRKKLGLRGFERDRCPFHDLRHTYITYMLNAGVPVTKVMSIVGHTSAAMTLDIYASVDPEMVRQAALSIGRIYDVATEGIAVDDGTTYELPAAAE